MPPVGDGDELIGDPVEEALSSNAPLIGFTGKDCLKEAFDSIIPEKEKVNEFIGKFRNVHSMKVPSVDPMLSLMEAGGISRTKASEDIITAQLEAMKRQIATLDQNQLNMLLEKSYSYLTVPKLSQIAISVLERLTYVEPEMWTQIVRQGLNESPYIDLPLSIKRRIWVSEVNAFDHEIDILLNRLPEVQPPATLEEFSEHLDRQKNRGSEPILSELLHTIHGVGEELHAQVIDKIVERATIEKSTPKRIAFCNLTHNYLLSLSPRPNSTLGTLRRLAKFLDSSNTTDGEGDHEVPRLIRDSLSVPSAGGPVALLISSVYSRDKMTEKLVAHLLSRRGPIERGLDGTLDTRILSEAEKHLRADPWIADLTFACLCNMKGGNLLEGGAPPSKEDVEAPFQIFYPLIIGEMEMDHSVFGDNFHNSNVTTPHPKLGEMVKTGRLERRIISSYCMLLMSYGNIAGASRFRLLLDDIVKHGDRVEEQREVALSHHLITGLIESG